MGRGFVALQYLLPQHLLCRIAYALTRCETAWIKNLLIRRFVRAYRPAMDDALEPEPMRYPSFNAFFTRALRAGARSFEPDPRTIGSCCDGTVSQAAVMREAELLQAKGRHYTPRSAARRGSRRWRRRCAPAATRPCISRLRTIIALHMPLAGHLRSAWHVPGRLFSVNEATAARVPALFARNERVICAFESEHGPFVLVLVGALFVGSMQHDLARAGHARAGTRGVQQLEARGQRTCGSSAARNSAASTWDRP